MLISGSKEGLYRTLFFIGAFIFISFAVAVNVFGLISVWIQIISILETVVFFGYCIVYLSAKRLSDNKKYLLFGFFLIELLVFISALSLTPFIKVSALAYLISAYEYIGAYFVLILPLIFLIFFGAYLYYKKYPKIALILLLAAIGIMVFYFFSGLVFQHYKIDDELLITFIDSKILLSGGNPYSASVSNQVFYNSTTGMINAPSITSTNKVIGTLNYPSLYLLSFVPFYLLSQPTFANLINFDLEIQQAVFLIILLLTVAFIIDKRYLGKPVYGIIVFFTIALAYLSSVTIYLMLALLLIAYAKLESKYSWVFLGLCASLQEQLWIPVLLLIIYSFNNDGKRKGAINILGTIGVFLAFNLYFILLNPHAFFGSLFSPINEMLLPEASSPIGYLLVTNFGIPLGSFSVIFAFAIFLICILFAYLNQKRFVGIFAMVPFLFLSHSIPIYYTFFTGFAIVSLFIPEKKEEGKIRNWMIENKGTIVATGAALVAILIYLLYIWHTTYQNNFSLNVTNASIHFDTALNKTVYTATLHYANLSNETVYLFAGAVSKYNIGFAGILNYALINDSTKCDSGDYGCMINVNRIVLPKNFTSYNLKIYINPSFGNPVYGVRINLYNGQYFYVGTGVFNQTILDSFSK